MGKSAAIVQTEKEIGLTYVMRSIFPDGRSTTRSERRMNFIFGVDRQVPSLEKAVEGRPEGYKGSIHIPASELYGQHDPSLIREIPKSGLIKQRLKEGRFYRQMKMGTLVSFKVLEVKPDTVVADFNKPMAGIRVSLEFRIDSIRDATREEIDAAMEAQLRKTIGCD